MLIGTKTIDGTLIELLTRGSEKRVITECDSCKSKSSTTFHNYCISQEKNGNTGQTFCRSCSNKKNGIRRRGKPSWNKGVQGKRGQDSPSWRGGSYISSDGYRMIHNRKESVKSNWSHYIKEHIYIMQEELGRQLDPDEVVHHIDGDKLNNDISNLIVMSVDEHNKLHRGILNLFYELVRREWIEFDREDRDYRI